MDAWAGWESDPWLLAEAWPAVGCLDVGAAPGAEPEVEPPAVPSAAVAALTGTDRAQLDAACGTDPWRVVEAWTALAADVLDSAPDCVARDEAAVVLMDVTALADTRLAVWGCAEAARMALRAHPAARPPARRFLDGLYAASRPSPQIVRRAVNLTPVVEVASRIYAV